MNLKNKSKSKIVVPMVLACAMSTTFILESKGR